MTNMLPIANSTSQSWWVRLWNCGFLSTLDLSQLAYYKQNTLRNEAQGI